MESAALKGRGFRPAMNHHPNLPLRAPAGAPLALAALLVLTPARAQVVTTDLTLWLKTDAGVSTTAVGDDLEVTLWEDQSGNGNHVVAGSSAPRLQEDVVNGQPALYFDGRFRHDLLQREAVDRDDLVSETAATAFLVFKNIFLGSGSDDGFLSWVPSGENRFSVVTSPAAGTEYPLLQTGNNGIAAPITTDSWHDRWFVWTIVFDHPGAAMRVNGVDQTGLVGGTGPVADGTASLFIGYDSFTSYFDGHLAEVLLYRSALGASDIAGVEGYLMDKYAVPEPAACATLAGAGLVGFALARRRLAGRPCREGGRP